MSKNTKFNIITAVVCTTAIVSGLSWSHHVMKDGIDSQELRDGYISVTIRTDLEMDALEAIIVETLGTHIIK